MPWPVNPDEDNHRLESRMRENRTYGSEGGEGFSPFRPLSSAQQKNTGFRFPGSDRQEVCLSMRDGCRMHWEAGSIPWIGAPQSVMWSLSCDQLSVIALSCGRPRYFLIGRIN